MKAWRRTSRSPSSPTASPPVVTVVDVFAAGGPNAVGWQFSATIASTPNSATFLVNGVPALLDSGFVGDTLTLTYALANFGDPWSVVSSAGITFVGGGVLAVPESGTID